MKNHAFLSGFGLHKKSIVAIVGGGGKSSLMFVLANSLSGRVVMTTTTRIFAAQMKLANAVVSYVAGDEEQFAWEVEEALAEHGRILIVGPVIGDKAHGVPSDLPARLLQREDVDFVLVEADGSRMRPIKAPAAHEPVIPPESTHVFPVVGIDALDKSLADVAHRPELVAQMLNWEPSAVSRQPLSEREIAQVIMHVEGGMKGVPVGARVIPVINKVETAVQLRFARHITHTLLTTSDKQQTNPIHRVAITALKTERPFRELHRRVTAVILAAGESKRMGRTKQLLPWGESTVLEQTIRNVQDTAVHDILVVTGHEADEIGAIAQAKGVNTVYNPHYATGEMISSLQTAVRHLPDVVEAVLVVLADQPMILPATMDQLLTTFWQMAGNLIAPTFDGKRGNPVLIDRLYFEELLTLTPDDAPRTLLKRHQSALHLVPVNTDTILRDLDGMDAYLRERPKR